MRMLVPKATLRSTMRSLRWALGAGAVLMLGYCGFVIADGWMYQKRSGWVLTGVAPNRGPETSLADIEVAVQTEIPLVKQHLCDTAWAVRGTSFDRIFGGKRLSEELSNRILRRAIALEVPPPNLVPGAVSHDLAHVLVTRVSRDATRQQARGRQQGRRRKTESARTEAH